MKRRRKHSGRQSVHDAVPSDEVELALGAEQIGQAERPAKVLKVRAATETDVLAVIDLGAGRFVDKRAGTAAQTGPRLQHGHADAPLGQRHGGSQTSQSPADNHRAGGAGASSSSRDYHDWFGDRRPDQSDAIDERRRKSGRLDPDFVVRLEFPVARAEAEPARAEEMQMDVTRSAMLRILEVMVLEIPQRVTHRALAASQLAAVVDRASAAKDRAAQRDVLEIGMRVERGPHRTGAQFRRRQVEITDLLGGVVRPFVPQGEPQPPRPAGRIDHVAADDFRLFAPIERERRHVERGVMAAQDAAVPLVKPFGRFSAHAGGRLPPFESAGEHARRIGEWLLGLRCLTRGRVRCTVHLVARLHTPEVAQSRAADQNMMRIRMIHRTHQERLDAAGCRPPQRIPIKCRAAPAARTDRRKRLQATDWLRKAASKTSTRNRSSGRRAVTS